MNLSNGISLSISLCVAGLLAGCGQEAAPPPEQPVPEVATVTVEVESVTLTRALPGRVTPYLVAQVRPQVTGIVRERLFEEGSDVEQGAALYQLDDATYRAEYNSAKARLARAEATLALARQNAERTRGLFEANAVSQREQDNAASALLQAVADLGVAEAAVENTKVLLDYARIVAPISGRASRSSVTQGALVTANQERELATIQQLDPIYVDVTQSSRELLELRQAVAAGDLEEATLPVSILLEGGARYEHEGEIAFSEVTVDPTTGRFALRVVVPNPDRLLLPGMYVRAELGMGRRGEAILVPQQAVTRGATGETSVMVVGPDNSVEQRPVTVSRTVGSRWLVDEGLTSGERVVTEGLQKIQPGMQVRLAGDSAAGPED